MIEIKNRTNETIRVHSSMDLSQPGCRGFPVEDSIDVKSGERILLMGYEPGSTLRIEPAESPEFSRQWETEKDQFKWSPRNDIGAGDVLVVALAAGLLVWFIYCGFFA